MSYLVDTNVLLRIVQISHQMHDAAATATVSLLNQNEQLFITPQNLIEFWAVATRPPDSNGLGLGIAETSAHLAAFKNSFELLADTEAIFSEWEGVVTRYQVSGKQVYDARVVAAMNVHQVRNLLTFNTRDFKRFIEITAVDPREVSLGA